MAQITKSVDAAVSVSTADNQWTQFEEFPRFMEGVQSVQQLDDTPVRWIAEIGGKHEEWQAEITEQHPDERVAWKAIDGRGNAGVVTFQRLSDEETRVRCRGTGSPKERSRTSERRSVWTTARCRRTWTGSKS